MVERDERYLPPSRRGYHRGPSTPGPPAPPKPPRRWFRLRRGPFVRVWLTVLLTVGQAVAVPLGILQGLAADEEIRRTGQHLSTAVLARHVNHGKNDDPSNFTVLVDGRKVRVETDDTVPQVGETVEIAVGPGPHGRVVTADGSAERESAHQAAWLSPLALGGMALGFGLGPHQPRYRAARAGARGRPRTTAVIVAKGTAENPNSRVRQVWHSDGPYRVTDLRLADGRVLRWQGCQSAGLPPVGGVVTLVGKVGPGEWVVIESPPGGPNRWRTYSWPDRPLEISPTPEPGGSPE